MIRYIVERIADGEFLELELPIIVNRVSRKRGGPGTFSGEIAPVVGAYRFAGTDQLIDAYATYIHQEVDGVIRGTWLVTRSEFEGYVWRVEGAGFSAYFNDRPYEGEYRGVQVDPIQVARHIAQHAQAFANANIGVTVTGSSTVRVGTDSDAKVVAADEELREAKRTKNLHLASRTQATQLKSRTSKQHDTIIKGLQATSKQRLEEVTALRKAGADKGAIEAAQSARNAAVQAVNNARAAKKAALAPIDASLAAIRNAITTAEALIKSADAKLKAAKSQQKDDEGAWKLLYWDTPDCFQSMQEAFDAAGYEWVEWSGWNTDGTRVLKEIRAVPRVGRRQDSLRFIEGDNIIDPVVVEADSDGYANVVKAIGAGEGKDALEYTVGVPSTRRRKVHTLDAKHVTKKDVLKRLARAELDLRSRVKRVSAVRVLNHPNAEFGTFDVGDIILIDIDAGWVGHEQILQRIEEVEYVGDDLADLILGDI